MNLFRPWTPKVRLALIGVGVIGIALTASWGARWGDLFQWAVIVLLGAMVFLVAWFGWRMDQSDLGASPARLAEVTRWLAQDQLIHVQTTLSRGGQGVLGDLATVVGNLQKAKIHHEERAWRDQGLALQDTARLHILARDVSIAREKPAQSSIQNILSGRIDRCVDDDAPGSVIVRVLIGETPLLARITARSVAELALKPGDAIWVQVKSVALAR
jgi:molybdopterin-binding protein